jgi:uncharacterized repeat protein (TIGR03943 family)
MEAKRILQNIATLFLYVIILGSYGKLFFTGEVFTYLRPVYAYLSFMVAFFVFILLSYSLYLLIRRKHALLRFKCTYLVIIIPFMASLLHTPGSYSAQTIEKKIRNYRMDKHSLLAERFKAVHDKSIDIININEETFYLYLYEFYMKKGYKSYLNRSFVIRGIYFRNNKNFYKKHAFVGRFIMVCCAADALMDGFFLKFNGDLPSIEPGKWIEVKGRLIYEMTKSDKMMPVIEVSSYRSIRAERNNYILPVLPSGKR